MIDLAKIAGFDWDDGNSRKSTEKHNVIQSEAEQIFFNQPLVVAPDEAHSHSEHRFFVLGRTDAARLLFLVFTARKHLVRVISARGMSRSEKEAYKNHEE